jgi:hypothetical protein
MISPSNGGAMANSEWLSECAAPSNASCVLPFADRFTVLYLLFWLWMDLEVRVSAAYLLKP